MADWYQEKIDCLSKIYPELGPKEYYDMMFPVGSFQQKDVDRNNLVANGILQFRKEGWDKGPSTVIIFDDHKVIDACVKQEGIFTKTNFAIVSGCSFFGRSRKMDHAGKAYAIIIDLDDVAKQQLENLMYMFVEKIAPMPTAINISGNGVHIVYMLEEPVSLTTRMKELLTETKQKLTDLLWTPLTSTKNCDPEHQSLVQGYRMVGTLTKKGHICRSFMVGRKIPYDILLAAVGIKGSNKPTIDEAKILYPEWYEKRIVQDQPRGHLVIGRSMYDKFLAAIKKGAKPGHRYNCILCLGAIAQKCNISKEEFEKDAYSLLDLFNSRSISKDNPFTIQNIENALFALSEGDYTRITIETIEQLTGVKYHKKKKSKKGKGRPTKEAKIKEYIKAHPDKTVMEIARKCGVSRNTVYKYRDTN